MSVRIVVAGTDTGVGKTVFAAGLAGTLDGFFWKPIQAGLDGETDSETVARLSGLPADRILPEVYRLKMAASPHTAARREGLEIDPDRLVIPNVSGPLVIEGAGGLMVPLNERALLVDILEKWRLPVVLCARTTLGTINHSLLTIEALRRRTIPVPGIAFIGEANEETERTIAHIGGVRRLGRLPFLDLLDRESLRAAFSANFDLARL